MAKRPTGPEDPTPGPEVRLTADQVGRLAQLLGAQRPHQKDSFLHRPKGSVRLVDRGAAYVEVQFIDPEGEVIKKELLFPVAPGPSPAAIKKALRLRDQPD
jgi:hypothetical protein